MGPGRARVWTVVARALCGQVTIVRPAAALVPPYETSVRVVPGGADATVVPFGRHRAGSRPPTGWVSSTAIRAPRRLLTGVSELAARGARKSRRGDPFVGDDHVADVWRPDRTWASAPAGPGLTGTSLRAPPARGEQRCFSVSSSSRSNSVAASGRRCSARPTRRSYQSCSHSAIAADAASSRPQQASTSGTGASPDAGTTSDAGARRCRPRGERSRSSLARKNASIRSIRPCRRWPGAISVLSSAPTAARLVAAPGILRIAEAPPALREFQNRHLVIVSTFARRHAAGGCATSASLRRVAAPASVRGLAPPGEPTCLPADQWPRRKPLTS